MPNPIIDIGYRYATQRYEGDGTTTDWDFNFAGPAPGYLDATHIRCSFVDYNVTRIETPIPSNQVSLIGVNRIRVIPAIPAGVTLVIRRDTPKAQPEVDYTEGGILNEKNLDTTTRQAIYAAAEMVDYFADLLVDFAQIDENSFEAIEIAQNALAVANNALLTAQAAFDAATNSESGSAAALAAAAQAALDAQQAALDAAAALAAANQAALDAAAAQQAAQDALDILETISSGTVGSIQIIGQMEVAFNIIGRLNVVSEEVCRYIAGNPFTIDAGTGSAKGFVSLRIAPQSNMAFQIFKNATQIGNISVNASSNTGTITITTASSFVPGDTLTVVNNTADELAETLSITLKGRRT